METIIAKAIRRIRQETIKEFQYFFSGSRPKKILFDHLPKCGGSSLTEYLAANYPRRKTFSTDNLFPHRSVEKFKTFSERKRFHYDLVKGHNAHDLLDFAHPDCLKVTVFRDPVERIISHYYYVKNTPQHALHGAIVRSGMSLEQYATSNLSLELRNWYTTHFSGLNISEAELRPEESVAIAHNILMTRYDVIGFLDDFALFTEEIRRLANLRYEYQNRKVNVTKNKPSNEAIPPSVINKIEAVNFLDIALYKKLKSSKGQSIT